MINEIVKSNDSKLEGCIRLINLRLSEMPNHDLYQSLGKQLQFIKSNLGENKKLSNEVFDKLNIGVLCVKELEHIDDEFCDLVYEMLEEVGPKISWGFD